MSIHDIMYELEAIVVCYNCQIVFYKLLCLIAVPVRRRGRPKPEMDKGANWERKNGKGGLHFAGEEE